MNKNESPPLDLNAALDQFLDDREFLFEMFQDYKANLPERMKDLRAALQANDAKELCRHAHNLKGISMNFFANPVIELALKIETAGKQENLVAAPELIEELEKEIRRLDEYLTSLLEENA